MNKIDLRSFSFEVVTVNPIGKVTHRETKQAKYFTETICSDSEDKNIGLDMVYIPGGSFIMGGTDEEIKFKESRKYEQPRHQVTVPSFFFGKYPVTQQQWRAVAVLPKVNRDLEPELSRFQDDNFLPVEKVNWYDAVEFCDRLSQHTGKPYRLCSEAEWEYACRADTTTPFHFGETITSDLANIRSHNIYATKYLKKITTTPVGSFRIANNFGLYDMHGNVYEWCLDDYHDNYKGAPKDGSAWLDNQDDEAIIRGGSWISRSNECRCSSRNSVYRERRGYSFRDIGFRIACGVENLFKVATTTHSVM
jgi:formylglycine-generating enzyme required for sulfatase activity